MTTKYILTSTEHTSKSIRTLIIKSERDLSKIIQLYFTRSANYQEQIDRLKSQGFVTEKGKYEIYQITDLEKCPVINI